MAGMLLINFFQWWYTRGWFEFGKKLINRLSYLIQLFSIPMLLRTLFNPWKRITTIAGKSVGEKARAALDNLISRLIGFLTRIIVIISGLIIMLLTGVVGFILFIIWPFIPFIIIFLIYRTFI